mgnify:CR=1 FL=1
MGGDGFYAADQLLFYTAMARDAGWGKDIPDMLRNEYHGVRATMEAHAKGAKVGAAATWVAAAGGSRTAVAGVGVAAGCDGAGAGFDAG